MRKVLPPRIVNNAELEKLPMNLLASYICGLEKYASKLELKTKYDEYVAFNIKKQLQRANERFGKKEFEVALTLKGFFEMNYPWKNLDNSLIAKREHR